MGDVRGSYVCLVRVCPFIIETFWEQTENVMSTATITEWSNNNNFCFKKDCVTYEHVQHPSQQIFSLSQFLSVPSCHSWVWNGAKHRGARVLVAPVPPATLSLCEESMLHLSIRILWFKMNSYYSYLNIFIFQRRGSKRRASVKNLLLKTAWGEGRQNVPNASWMAHYNWNWDDRLANAVRVDNVSLNSGRHSITIYVSQLVQYSTPG